MTNVDQVRDGSLSSSFRELSEGSVLYIIRLMASEVGDCLLGSLEISVKLVLTVIWQDLRISIISGDV
jgi:hypothetical protein